MALDELKMFIGSPYLTLDKHILCVAQIREPHIDLSKICIFLREDWPSLCVVPRYMKDFVF